MWAIRTNRLRPLPGRRVMLFLPPILLFLVFIAGMCRFLRISGPKDIDAFLGMSAECPPVWKLFAFHRFSPGDSADKLFRKFPPTHKEEFGRYGIYSFSKYGSGMAFTKVCAVTRDGKLIAAGAGSCTWHFTFFTTSDPNIDIQYAAFVKERHHKLEQERLHRLESELLKFYNQRDRWPTNEVEFGWFVTGEEPPPEPPPSANRSDKQFTATMRNPLGVTLQSEEDESLTLSLNGEPDLVGTVPKPPR